MITQIPQSAERRDWFRVEFEATARLVRDVVAPAQLCNQPYIGLEHIGEGSLMLRGTGLARNTRSNKWSFQKGDILFGKLRPYFRKIIRAATDGVCSTDIWVVRPKRDVDPGFLFYLMASPAFVDHAVRGSEGTRMPRAKWEFVSRFRCELPSISEQRAIAHVLGTLDDKIELNRRMNKTLEAMAKAIFKDWFVDFGPVRAKLEGHEPYLPPEFWKLFPSRFTELSKGNIPVTWQKKFLGECFNLAMGQSPPGSSYNEVGHGLPFFQGKTDFGFRFPTNRRFCSAPSRIAQPGDTLVSVRAPVGDTNMAWERCCIGRGVAALRHVSKSESFTYYSIGALRGRIAEFEDSGTVFGAITRKQFETLKIIEPTPDAVRAFDELVGPIDRYIRHNIARSRNLTRIRDALIPKLVSGEVRLENAETVIGQLV